MSDKQTLALYYCATLFAGCVLCFAAIGSILTDYLSQTSVGALFGFVFGLVYARKRYKDFMSEGK